MSDLSYYKRLAPFTQKQCEYLNRVKDSWFNVCEGSKRAGKNILQVYAFCRELENHPDKIHLVAGVSSGSAGLNIIDCNDFGIKDYFAKRCKRGKFENRPCLYVSTDTGEKIILISGGNNKRSKDYIRGNSYGLAYITEANLCEKTFVQEVFDRTIASKNRKIFHDLNPLNDGHFYYTDILNYHKKKQEENSDYGFNYGHFVLSDNMSLSDDKLREILNTYQKGTLWYSRDISGERRNADGLIYENFNRSIHVVPTINRNYLPNKYIISCDMGVYNPTAWGLWGVCNENGKNVHYLIKEYFHDGRKDGQKSDEQYFQDLLKFTDGYKIQYVIVDPSAATFLTAIHRKFQGIKADNKVLEGIKNVTTCLYNGLIKINECCENTIREFESYSWDTDIIDEDVPIKENDHMMDSCRYYCQTMKIAQLHAMR